MQETQACDALLGANVGKDEGMMRKEEKCLNIKELFCRVSLEEKEFHLIK